MKIRIAIVDSRIDAESIRNLMLHGFRVLSLPPFSKLSEAVSSHPDMLIKAIGKDYFSYADYCEDVSYVFTDLSLMTAKAGIRLSFTSDEVLKDYPHDVGLNALTIGGKLYCRIKSASYSLLECAKKNGIEVVNVNQGYPACTVLKLSESAAITADDGMAKALSENGIRVTKITPGYIDLPPHKYGFIGGAGAVHDGKLYLFGDLKTHPDYLDIMSAIEEEGLCVVPLCSGRLRDLGGILFIEENID